MAEDMASRLVEEVKKQLNDLLGTAEIEVDRDKLWEFKLLSLDLKMQEAAVRGDETAFYVLVEMREVLIDEKYPLDDQYYREKTKLEESFKKYLTTAPRNEYEARLFARKLFEYLKLRLKLQNEHMKRHSVLKVIAHAIVKTGVRQNEDQN